MVGHGFVAITRSQDFGVGNHEEVSTPVRSFHILTEMLGAFEEETFINVKEPEIIEQEVEEIEKDEIEFPLTTLPPELLVLIFSHLDPQTARRLSKASKFFNNLSTSTSARSSLFLNHYGKGACIYQLYANHKMFLSVDLIQALMMNGGLFPRFLAQIVVQDFQSRTRAVPEIALYVFSIKYAFEQYLEKAEFKSNDHRLFESLVRVSPLPPEPAQDAINGLEQLIVKYKFFPVIDRSFRIFAESLYLMANLDIRLISLLVTHTGFELSPYNDKVMDRVFQQVTISENIVQNYLSVGFRLSDYAVKKALAYGRPLVFEILDSLLPPRRLKTLVEAAVFDLFGPYLDRETSLNVPWNSDAVSRLINHYNVPIEVVEGALLTHPGEKSSFEVVHESFPVTRPYLKSKPYLIWRWVLDQYGPHHSFTMACFDDALSRAVSDESLHELLEYFLESGVVMRPRHVKILACRVLHRNMTSNALEMMIKLGEQVRERHRKTGVQRQTSDTEVDQVTLIKSEERGQFKLALERDMLQNREWKERSKSIQLGSGHHGGTFRIDRAPADVIRFTEEGTRLMGDLVYWEKQELKSQSDLHLDGREQKPKGFDAMKPSSYSTRFKLLHHRTVVQSFRSMFLCGTSSTAST